MYGLPTRLSTFIGRSRQIEEVVELLAGHRHVTLVGAPGVGKTRLALQAAEDLQRRHAEGVTFVELAGLSEPALVPVVVAGAFGIHESGRRPILDSVAELLRDREVVLLLDNCEHLIDAAAALAESLLGHCPGLRLLATSREALRCEGERIWRVPSLTAPALDVEVADTGNGLEGYESVRLFVDRAQAARPTFALTPENADAVATICARLDGIPLAIELAAARLAILSPHQIAARLDDRLRLLAGGARTALPRHQTLEAALDWSYRLLSPSQQTLLARLAVFAGGWTLDAATAITADDSGAADAGRFLQHLASLVDKSLVQVDEDASGEPRYRLLEMVRQYAFERLSDAGELAATRERHLDWFLAHAERTEPLHYWAPPVAWLDRLERDHDNLRAALDWTIVGGSFDQNGPSRLRERGLRLALALFWPWFDRDHLGELRRWFEPLLAATEGEVSPLRARALLAASLLARHQGQLDATRQLHEQGLALAIALGDTWAIAWGSECASHIGRSRGDPEASRSYIDVALRRFEEVGDRWGVSWALRDLGSVALYQGDFETATDLLERSLALSRQIGDEYCASLALEYLGLATYRRGDLARALRLLEDAHEIAWRLKYGQGISRVDLALGRVVLATGDLARATSLIGSSLARYRVLGQPSVADCIEQFARIAVQIGDPAGATRLVGAASAIRDAHDWRRQPIDAPEFDGFLARLRTALPDGHYERHVQAGLVMSLHEAVDETEGISRAVSARDDQGERRGASGRLSARQVERTAPGPLTPREREVAALISAGLTNRQIAERLVVSRRTVDAHVASILARLGFASRARIAVWAASQQEPDSDSR